MLADIILKVAGMETEFWAETYHPRPSCAGRCIRQLVYRSKGVPPGPWPDRVPVVFDDGNWHAEMTLEWLSKSAFKIHDREMKVHCGTVAGQDVTGSIDALFEDLVGVDRLLEHKSTNHFTFQRHLALIEAGLPFPDDESYMAQVQLYLNSRELREAGIKQAVLLFKNKNTGQYCEFIIDHDPALAESFLKQLEAVEEHVKGDTMPTRPYNRDVDWQCDYCRYAKPCWDGYDEERDEEIHETDDEELSEAADVYADAASINSTSAREKKEAKKRVVHALDRLGLTQAKVPSGLVVKWLKKHRKGYAVKPSDYQELRVTRPKK